jgi:N6-adenosine-specific RNA methylase IME4/ParB-like chromosome segregation protein Spo0J
VKKRALREVPVAKVVVPAGRRLVGDITQLAASIAEVGLLHPIVVTSDLRLVAGLHRLRACERLGWKTISVTIVAKSKLINQLAEIDENLVRAELSVLQRAEQLARRKHLHEALHPETRRGVAGGRASGGSRRGERTTDTVSLVRHVASRAGVSTRTIERQVQIATAIPTDLRRVLHKTWVAHDQQALLQIARLDAGEQRAVVERISEGARSVRLAKVSLVASTLKNVKPPTGRYRVIVIDPPWPYETSLEEYPSASFEQIRALPVGRLAENDSILWLWTTNLMMRHVYPLLDAWGFAEATILTWVKHKIGKGWYLRNQTEHCVVAVRGRPALALEGQSTFLQAHTRERGRKPDEFYRLVEGLCPGAKLDMFARQSRKGWTTWGAEATKFDSAAEPKLRRR